MRKRIATTGIMTGLLVLAACSTNRPEGTDKLAPATKSALKLSDYRREMRDGQEYYCKKVPSTQPTAQPQDVCFTLEEVTKLESGGQQ
jgi:hypothetical protein